VGDGVVDIEMAPTVGERIVSDVQNSHNLQGAGLTYAG
jgi:hypothetical protein